MEIQGDKWEVQIPEDAETDLPKGHFTLVCGTIEEIDEGLKQLHPESPFFQDVLEDAADNAPLGGVSIDASHTEIIIPDWLQEADISVTDAEFLPYYDRRALAVLFRVSIETVSEYQREFLRAIAIDTRSEETLPNLDQTFLDLTEPGRDTITSHEMTTEMKRIQELVDASRKPLVEDIQPTIDETHQEASRAADAELEEYRQLQQQREEELAEKLDRLQSRIEELNAMIDDSEQEDRVEALKERRDRKSDQEDIESELTKLRQQREQGYPEQQREIRNRHALEVVVTPVTVTEIEYERGDAEFKLTNGGAKQTITVGYGSGVGVTEEVSCDECGQPLTTDRPLGGFKEKLRCVECN
ncbi:hypothetical protein C471_06268 [Halorubrum saccharovorum DSM 1137]|uniref:Uncharacterized protein n=1 Tax=Halorubrum saccharovorum DSM 1137 TaxID=1227484 RepID=M0E3Z2_9EURY|nr:hypothetical protein C471_06268 [Halorubrum saccharovorum DSM 1137]